MMRQSWAAICVIVICLAWISCAASEMIEEHFDKARELLNTGSYEEAAEEFHSVADLVPEGSEIAQNATYWVGQCYFKMKEFDEALSTFEKIVREYPESALVDVAQVMMDRVRQEKENEKFRARMDTTSDRDIIVDPKTGLKFTRIYSDEKLNLISHNLGLIISPDGRFLFDHHERLAIPLKEGEEPFSLAPDIIATAYGSWSPDMSRFAFITRRTGDFYVVPVSPGTGRSTGPARKIMEGVGERNETRRGTMPPTWSPDGKQLAFQYKKDESFDIWTIPAEGGIPTQMTGDPHWEKSPVWAPDGKSIVFNRKRELTDQAGPWDIWVVPAEGGEPEKIVDEAYTQLGFSPDGKWLAFHRKGVWEAVSVLHLGDRREFT